MTYGRNKPITAEIKEKQKVTTSGLISQIVF